MAGVFGVGVVTKLQEVDAYDKFSHVYGASAGAFDIAYFLDRQTRKGSSIYWEDLIKDFIDFSKLHKAILNIILGKKYFPNVVNIDHLIRVSQTTKELDVEEIKRSPIEARVKVYNLGMKKIEYLDLKEDTFQRLKESSSVAPYFYLEGQENIDGGILEPLEYDLMRKNHPGQKIVFVINYNLKRGIIKRMQNSLEGMLVSRMFDNSELGKMFSEKATKLEIEAEKIRTDKSALLITPPDNNPTTNTTTDPNKLKHTYHLGILECKKILEFIE
ncbi:MAG: patatin-like phospholipase family protein [archaeon]